MLRIKGLGGRRDLRSRRLGAFSSDGLGHDDSVDEEDCVERTAVWTGGRMQMERSWRGGGRSLTMGIFGGGAIRRKNLGGCPTKPAKPARSSAAGARPHLIAPSLLSDPDQVHGYLFSARTLGPLRVGHSHLVTQALYVLSSCSRLAAGCWLLFLCFRGGQAFHGPASRALAGRAHLAQETATLAQR